MAYQIVKPKKIRLKCSGHYDEGVVGTAFKPGMAIELQSDGEFHPVDSAAATAVKEGFKIAIEDALQGKTIDEAYVVGEICRYYVPRPGDHLYVMVKSGENIAVRDFGVIDEDGYFVEAAGSEGKFNVEFLESSGGALGSDTHLRARVL